MRVATFNVCHGSTGRGTPVDLDRLAAACAALGADVLALQEVDQGRRRSGGVDQAARVAATTGATYAFAPALDAASRAGFDGAYGNALLCAGTLTDVEVLTLPRFRLPGMRPSEPRGALLATAVVGDRSVSVAATHLSTRWYEAVVQLRALSRALQDRPGPQVLLGDCNLGLRVASLVLRPSGLRPVTAGGPTHPRRAARVRIDHVAVAELDSAELVVAGVDVVDTGTSDHRALVVELDGSSASG